MFGTDAGFAASLDLAVLDGSNGFRLDGADAMTQRLSVSAAGDVNGDGIDDLIVGTHARAAGASYVVFGTDAGFAASLDLAALDGSTASASTGPLPMTTAARPSPPPATSTAMASTT